MIAAMAARLTKSEITKMDWAISYIRAQLKTGRHIIACLGSAGITFADDVVRFKEYARDTGAQNIAGLIDKYLLCEMGRSYGGISEEIFPWTGWEEMSILS